MDQTERRLTTKKQTSHRNRRFSTVTVHSGDTPQQIVTENLWSNGLKQPVTHTQSETTEIIQQCIMEEGIQPRSHLCIFQHLGYVRNLF